MTSVALIQLAVNDNESIDHRVERALDLTEDSAGSADMVVLPELWPTGAFDVDYGIENALPIDNELVVRLQQIADSTGTWIHGGSFLEGTSDGEFFNTSFLIDCDGEVRAQYRKIHLFGFDGGEAAKLTSGTDLMVIETPLGMTGLATCYDLRFPEMFRALLDRGATAVLLASGWPTSRIKRWTVLAKARAIENEMLFVGCNSAGSHNGTELGGESIVVDPWGDVIASGPLAEEAVVFAEIDPKQPLEVRESFPVLKDRRL